MVLAFMTQRQKSGIVSTRLFQVVQNLLLGSIKRLLGSKIILLGSFNKAFIGFLGTFLGTNALQLILFTH